MDLVGLATQAHQLLTAIAAVGAAGLLLLTSSALVMGRADRPAAPSVRAAIDWLIVGVPLIVALAAILGLVLFAGTGGPSDGLHAVYAIVAIVTLPLARVLGAGPPADSEDQTRRADAPPLEELTPRLAAWLAIGAMATLGALLRLAGTG